MTLEKLGGCSGAKYYEICYRFCHTDYCNDGVGDLYGNENGYPWNDGELSGAYGDATVMKSFPLLTLTAFYQILFWYNKLAI